MGGFNSQAIDYVCGLTPKQVAAWYAGPLSEANKRAEDGGETPPAGRVTLADFKAEFGGQYADRPEDWWRQKYAEFEESRRANEGE